MDLELSIPFLAENLPHSYQNAAYPDIASFSENVTDLKDCAFQD